MNSTNEGNRVKCVCGGYLKPESIDAHLETRVHHDRMQYPNGFKCELTNGMKYVVVWKDRLTMEEQLELIKLHPSMNFVITYKQFVIPRAKFQVERTYDISE